MDFTELIISAYPYLDSFCFDDYTPDFERFSEQAGPILDQFIEKDASALIPLLIEELEQMHSGLSRRAAKDAAFRDKQVLALFFSPAAMRHSEAAALFSASLCDAWNSRYPKNTYRQGSFESILAGFDETLLGIKLRKTKKNIRQGL